MKKFYLIFFASLSLLFLFSATVSARSCAIDYPELRNALVQCGQYPVDLQPNGEPIPQGYLGPRVLGCPCGLADVFQLILRIYTFIVWNIATPLAALLIVVGGVIWVVSAGNPGLFSWGKTIFWGAAIGLALIFGSWLIIDIVLRAIGYTGFGVPWWKF